MDRIPDCQQWAQEHFGTAKLGDPRRTKRLVGSAAAIAAHPEISFPSIFDWNELRAFYNLCGRDEATLQSLQTPHWQLTRQAMATLPLVLIVHDTTELDFTSHHALQGAGPIGDHRGKGFLQHNSLAFSPDGSRLLGLAYQQVKVRQPTPPKETRKARKKRAARVADVDGRHPGPGRAACGLDLGGRRRPRGRHLRGHGGRPRHRPSLPLPRLPEPRGVQRRGGQRRRPGRGGVPDGARPHAGPPGGRRGRGAARAGPAGRTAQVKLAACAVRVPPPRTAAQRKKRPTLSAWVIRVWEPSPPLGVKALEWVLLCSVRTETLEQIKERRGWYAVRWGAEVYHDIEKNGCSEEDRRFESVGSMVACLGVLAVVAVRVYQLRLAVKTMPDAPACEVATAEEIGVMQEQLGKKGLTVLQFVRGVAKLGGFLGRKGDGEAGIRSLWRGYQRLQDMVVGFRLRGKQRHALP